MFWQSRVVRMDRWSATSLLAGLVLAYAADPVYSLSIDHPVGATDVWSINETITYTATCACDGTHNAQFTNTQGLSGGGGNNTPVSTVSGTKSSPSSSGFSLAAKCPDDGSHGTDTRTFYVVDTIGFSVPLYDSGTLNCVDGNTVYVAQAATGDVVISARLTSYSGTLRDNFIYWEGGSAGASQLERKVSRTTTGATTLTCKAGNGTQVSMTVVVVSVTLTQTDDNSPLSPVNAICSNVTNSGLDDVSYRLSVTPTSAIVSCGVTSGFGLFVPEGRTSTSLQHNDIVRVERGTAISGTWTLTVSDSLGGPIAAVSGPHMRFGVTCSPGSVSVSKAIAGTPESAYTLDYIPDADYIVTKDAQNSNYATMSPTITGTQAYSGKVRLAGTAYASAFGRVNLARSTIWDDVCGTFAVGFGLEGISLSIQVPQADMGAAAAVGACVAVEADEFGHGVQTSKTQASINSFGVYSYYEDEAPDVGTSLSFTRDFNLSSLETVKVHLAGAVGVSANEAQDHSAGGRNGSNPFSGGIYDVTYTLIP